MSRVVTAKWQGSVKRVLMGASPQGSAKRVLIAHQWTGGPDKDWLPWAKKMGGFRTQRISRKARRLIDIMINLS